MLNISQLLAQELSKPVQVKNALELLAEGQRFPSLPATARDALRR